MKADFVIAGGGIGGSVLGELLARGGRRVVVLERGTGPPPFLRPEILWPSTAQTLFSLAPQSLWEERAMLPLRGIRVHDGRKFVPVVSEAVLAEAGVQPWFIDPNETREALLAMASCDLRRGVEVTEIVRENGRIAGVVARARNAADSAAPLEFRGEWIVGDDGVHSRVRESCGIDLSLREFPVQFFCAAIQWPRELPEGIVHLWPNWGRSRSGILAMGAGSLPGGRGVALVVVDGAAFDANPDPGRSWREFSGMDGGIDAATGAIAFPGGFFRIVRQWGHARVYGAAGAVLLGDAAHPVSPAGGQGANMSVADAVALADLFLRGRGDAGVIAQYERRRRPANDRSMGPTRLASRFFGLPGWTAPAALRRGTVHWLARHPRAVARLLRSVSTLFIED